MGRDLDLFACRHRSPEVSVAAEGKLRNGKEWIGQRPITEFILELICWSIAVSICVQTQCSFRAGRSGVKSRSGSCYYGYKQYG